MKSQIDYLSEALDQIKQGMFELIDNSRILRFKNDPSSDVVFVSPEFYWDGPTAKEQQIQIELRRKYLKWVEIFQMIIENAPDNVKSKMSEIDSFILNWIDKGIEWGLPGTLEEAKARFEEAINPLYDTLKLYCNTENGSIILIPDTSALMLKSDPLAYKDYINQEKFTLALLSTVIRELHELKMKSWDPECTKKVKSVLKRLNRFQNRGNLHEGITIHRTIRLKIFTTEPDLTKAASWLDKNDNDDKIIAGAIEIQRTNPSDYVLIATTNKNIQNKAEMAYLPYIEIG